MSRGPLCFSRGEVPERGGRCLPPRAPPHGTRGVRARQSRALGARRPPNEEAPPACAAGLAGWRALTLAVPARRQSRHASELPLLPSARGIIAAVVLSDHTI